MSRFACHPRLLVALLPFWAVGCATDAVRWEPPERSQATMLPSAELVLGLADHPGVIERFVAPLEPNAPRCEGSLRFTQARGDTAWAVWWSPQDGGRMALLAARSTDEGLNWGEPLAVERPDPGRAGCERPAPSLAVSSATGAVFFVYAQPEDGAWVTRLRSVNGTGTALTAAVEVVRGDSASTATVAVDPATVAVAYLVRSGALVEVRLALARSSGQILDRRTLVAPAARVVSPPLVALRGDRVAVAWNESDAGDRPLAIVRSGRIR
jgi:hypothetical protein